MSDFMACICVKESYNNDLATILEKNKIKKLRLLNIGNSIASGYSLVHETKPLLRRNTYIEDVLKYYGIKYEPHDFARVQNNSDEHLYEMLISNIKESKLHEINRKDYTSSEIGVPTIGLDDNKMDKYYPLKMEEDLGFQDALLNKDKDTANIVIYNGCTGSFLDGITRGGSLKHQGFHGIKRDITSIEAILKWIQIHNRKGDSNTQVYLCGVPNLMGLKESEAMNHYLKKIAKEYANVTYVSPVTSQAIHKSGKGLKIDVHYDEDEYREFMKKIIASISSNYETNRAMIEIDRQFYQFSRGRELYFPELRNETTREEYMERTLNKELEKVNDKKKLLKRVRQYIKERFPYDFYYLGKDSLKKTYSKVKKERC